MARRAGFVRGAVQDAVNAARVLHPYGDVLGLGGDAFFCWWGGVQDSPPASGTSSAKSR